MNRQSKIVRFFSHNVTLLVLSIIIAFSIWFLINANSETDTNVTISDIPITIELPDDALKDGLQIFSGADVTASVEVTGNRITVGSLTKSDIQVVAQQSSSIIAPGSYTLELAAKKTGVKSDYNIVSSVSPSNVTIFVDKLKEKTFDITDEMVYKVKDGYYAASSLSETSVTISGPESEVSLIDKVAVQGTLDGEISESQTFEKALMFIDKDGEPLNLTLSNRNVNDVSVTLSVMKTLEVGLTVSTQNAPNGFSAIRISPEKIKIAGSDAALNTIKNATVNIGTVDFSKLRNEKNSLMFDITLPNGCKNLSNDSSATIDIDLSKYAKTEVVVNKFTSVNLSEDYAASFSSDSLKVTVYGPKSVIADITSADISAVADFTDKLTDITDETATMDLPLSFKFAKGFGGCWVYGDYPENVTIKKK